MIELVCYELFADFRCSCCCCCCVNPFSTCLSSQHLKQISWQQAKPPEELRSPFPGDQSVQQPNYLYRTTMKSFLLAFLCAFAALVSSDAFAPTGKLAVVPRVQSKTPVTTLNVFGNKKSGASKAAQEEKASQYWQGEWVCKDCGYIYNRVGTLWILPISRKESVSHQFVQLCDAG
jgi:hypothetical protein